MLCVAIGDIGRRIRESRETFREVGMKQTELARRLGISQQRLAGWEAGKHDPPSDVIVKAAATLEVSVQYLLSGRRLNPRDDVQGPKYPVSFPMVTMPYGGYVPASDWTDPFDTEDLIEVDPKFDAPGRFVCTLEGDSMYPVLEPGDELVFQAYAHRRAKIGDIILARRSEDGSVTVKMLQHDGTEFMLKAVNPKHNAPTAEKWEGVGYLVGVVRKKGSFVRSDFDPEGIRIANVLKD